jgi:hypothetical protein
LLCSDLFTQLGDGPATTDGDIVGPVFRGAPGPVLESLASSYDDQLRRAIAG